MLSSPLLKGDSPAFAERSVRFVGPLSSMSVRDAAELVRAHGGRVVVSVEEADAVVVGDGARVQDGDKVAIRSANATLEVLTEPQFLQRMVGADHSEQTCGLLSPSMLAELIGVPVAAIRRWRRREYLRPTQELGRLPLFDLCEVQVARRLASLLMSGCSLPQIDRLVAELESQVPGVERPLVSLAIEHQDGRLMIRDQRRLAEPSGQLVLDFEPEMESTAPVSEGGTIPMRVDVVDNHIVPETLRAEAWELADRGENASAIEACRVVLLSDDARADDHFLLAHLLYEQGDLSGARERYYAAVEHDDSFVEARINLGCVLGELGDASLAVAVLRGAVEIAPELPDACYHLARALDHAGESGEAQAGWRRFLTLSPSGPWAEHARSRLSPQKGSEDSLSSSAQSLQPELGGSSNG